MPATKDLVLVTGATGFQGSEIFKQLLEEGYKVRATARSEKKAQQFQEIYASYKDQIEVIIVEDQLAPNAYHEAVKGVSAIFHVASPINFNVTDIKSEFIDPAIKMTTNILEAANSEPSVKRLITTSSFAAVADPNSGGAYRDYEYSEKDWNPLTEEQAIASNNLTIGYMVSKTLAEKSAWNYIEDKKPHFDLVTFCPPMIYGFCSQPITSLKELNTSTEEIYRLLDAKEVPVDRFPLFVNVQDVARAQILALQTPKAGNQRYTISAGNFYWQEVVDALREKYPELKDRLPVGTPGTKPTGPICSLSSSKVVKDLGIKFQDWRTTIIDQSFDQLLRLEMELK